MDTPIYTLLLTLPGSTAVEKPVSLNHFTCYLSRAQQHLRSVHLREILNLIDSGAVMDRETIKSQIGVRLRDSEVVQTMADELCRLLSDRPADIPPGEFFHAAATALLEVLREKLLAHCQSGVLKDTDAGGEDADIGYDRILQGLLLSLERDLLESNLNMIRVLGGAIAERDTGTNEHNYRVTIYAVRLAEAMKLPRDAIRSLIKGAFVHDIGKIGIPDRILVKPEGLSADEREIMNSHVERGARIIGSAAWLRDAVEVVFYHHERWDGTGYLEGLKGEDIPLAARIFAVGDVFDALTADRPYKVPYAFVQARQMILDLSGQHFDPAVVSVFDRIVEDVYEEARPDSCEQMEDTIRGMVKDYFGLEVARVPLPTACD